jgi:hypothetical protein
MNNYKSFNKGHVKTAILKDRRHDDKGLLSLKAVSVLTFLFIVAMCGFGL